LTLLTFHSQELSGIHTGLTNLALIAFLNGATHETGLTDQAIIGFDFIGTFVLRQITGSGLARSPLIAVCIDFARFSRIRSDGSASTRVQTNDQNKTSESDIKCTHTRLLVPP